MANHNFKDITGQRYGKLVVIERVENTPRGQAQWKCQCDCGKTSIVVTGNLNNGHTTSCGCEKSECAIRTKTKHGQRHTKLYSIWCDIKARCRDTKSRNSIYYAKKNIKMCEEWNCDFTNFSKWALSHGYKDGLTIDRIDGDKGYSPDNCRWATLKEQNRNKINNINITYQGRTQCLAAWCEEFQLNYYTIRTRIRRGWTIERAFTTP